MKKKIQFNKSPVGFFNLAYFAGDVVEMPANQAEVLIEAGYAKEYAPAVNPQPDLPADLPGRDVFLSNGIKTLDELKLITDFTEIKGIGKKTAESIVKYLNK